MAMRFLRRFVVVAVVGVVAAGCGSGSSTVTVTRTVTHTRAERQTCTALLRAVNHEAVAIAHALVADTHLLRVTGEESAKDERRSREAEATLRRAYAHCD
jgi:hypothetical protein